MPSRRRPNSPDRSPSVRLLRESSRFFAVASRSLGCLFAKAGATLEASINLSQQTPKGTFNRAIAVGNGSGSAAIGTNNSAFLLGNGDDAIAAGTVPPPFTPGKNNTAFTLGNFSSASAIGNHKLAGVFGNRKTKVNTVG